MQFLNYAEFIRSRNSITESKREVSQEKLISDYHDNLFRGVKSTKREAQTQKLIKQLKLFSQSFLNTDSMKKLHFY